MIEYWFKVLECQIWLTNTKPFFRKNETNFSALQKRSPYIGVSYKFVLKSVKSLNKILWVIEYWFEALECQIRSKNLKPFFWESEAKLETLQKLSLYIGVCYKFGLKSVKTLNKTFWVMQYWFKDWECQIWSTNIKPFSWESEANLGTLQKVSPFIGVFKSILKSPIDLNRIIWVTEYLIKALECEIWGTNTKPFFRESVGKLQTLQKLPPYIRVSHKVALKSVKTLNRIFWTMEYWFKALECQIWLTNTNSFFWESETNLGTFQKLPSYISVGYKFVLKCVRNLSWLVFSFFQMLWELNFQLSNIQLEIMQQMQTAKMQTLEK